MVRSFWGRAGATNTNGSDASRTISGLGLQQNDLVIVAYTIGDDDNVNHNMAMVTAGYTEVADLFADDVEDCNFGVFWKLMGASPDSSAIVDGMGGTDAAIAAVAMVFRGVDTTTPMDVTPTTASGVNTNRPNPPSIDFSAASAWVVACGGYAFTSGTPTVTAPTNYSDIVERDAVDSTGAGVAMAYRTDPADPEDPGVFTPSIADSVDHAWGACTIALRPAAELGNSEKMAAINAATIESAQWHGREYI